MCGIGGGVAVEPGARPDPSRVKRISELLAHRGPDGEGLWSDQFDRVVLAHRRLSVIDLATGQQPMVSRDGRSAIVFNGEVYNYREIRDDLAREGHQFRTASDTEVMMAALAKRGLTALDQVRGMFAFAYWDADHERLTLARDRLGKKPLYYVVEDGCLYFASSLRALTNTTPYRWNIDLTAVDAYLSLGYIPAPLSIFREVRKLPAATALQIDSDGWKLSSFWNPGRDAASFDGTYEEATERLEEALRVAVSVRLRSDVPLGIFLSGGIDSSLIAAVAAREARQGLRTFSVSFDDAGFDESGHASAIAKHLGTEHRTIPVQTDVLGLLPRLVDHYGEPFADSSAMPTWVLSQATREHVTVALGGDGGDEGFAGYDWYGAANRVARLQRAIPSGVASFGSRTLTALGERFNGGSRYTGKLSRGMSILAMDDSAHRFAALRALTNRADATRLYAGELANVRSSGPGYADAELSRLYDDCEGGALRKMRYTDIRSYLSDCLLPKVDVASMAHGLEVRAPLLDHNVVEFGLSLPDEYLIDPSGGKRILKTLLARHVPAALFDRPKQGFDPPLSAWISGPLRQRVSALSRSDLLVGSGWLRPDGLAAMVREHVSGSRDHGERLFSLLILEEWLKQF